MKHIIAIVLLCLPTQVSAAERCSNTRTDRHEMARVSSMKPPAARSEIRRAPKVRVPAGLHRLMTGDIQIL